MFDRIKSLFSRESQRKLRVERKALAAWEQRGFSDNSPQFVKERVFVHHGVPGAQWIETGTYRGQTTEFLSQLFPFVHSIEPEPGLAKAAKDKFEGKNIEVYNGTSEEVMPMLLPKISGDVNFWLDGHYSAGITFRGEQDCPVMDELSAISKNLNHFRRVSILIDDVRMFLPEKCQEHNYPNIAFLIEWAGDHNFFWRIEHDIFIMTQAD